MTDQRAEVEWRDGGVPVSTRFDDPYYSLENGLEETRHVFLAGNGLPGRFRDGFRIAELGFGTGLNFLATWAAWVADRGGDHLIYTAFEAFPMRRAEAERALAPFASLGGATDLLAAWDRLQSGPVGFEGGITLNLVTGDARETLPRWAGEADAWFLDGFAPARNPELWEPSLMEAVAAHTAADGTAATYTAAGAVRRALAAAGFEVERAPGYGRKRHMTRARMA